MTREDEIKRLEEQIKKYELPKDVELERIKLAYKNFEQYVDPLQSLKDQLRILKSSFYNYDNIKM